MKARVPYDYDSVCKGVEDAEGKRRCNAEI